MDSPTNKQVFISYVEEDSEVVNVISAAIEKLGVKTWYYQRDSLPGLSYLVQIGRAIDAADAIVLVASKLSLASNQVTKEVIRGHESAKPFVPVLLDVTHREFQARPEWREAIGAASSISAAGGIKVALPRLIEGIAALLTVGASMQGDPERGARTSVEPAATAPLNVSEAPPPKLVDNPARPVVASRHELNQPFGEESCEYELALLQEDYPYYYFEETPFNADAIDPSTYLIVGRRGCGKSSLAHYFAFQKELRSARSIDVNEAQQFERILSIAGRIFYSTSMATPALVSVWELLIWSLVFREYQAVAGSDVVAAARKAEQVLGALLDEDVSPAEDIHAFLGDPLFGRAREAVLLVTPSQPVVIAVDTLEKYDLTNDPMMSLTAGLVECASNFNIINANRGIHVKAFLSAEIFPHVKESAVPNTSKFIRNELYLTWRPKDLMRLVCWRLDGYLNHRNLLPQGYVDSVDWRSFDEVHEKRWVPYFGESLANEFGKTERTFPFVLRHTQMRPRQLVILCNQIARLGLRAKRFPSMSDSIVVEAIRAGQRRLADEVLNSYSEIYPNVALIIDALHGLPMRFTGNLLDKVARKTASEWQGNYSPANFKRLVAELGIVGVERSINEKNGIIEADFEYSLEERLPLGDNAHCVIHPMFNAKLHVDQSQELIVLPFPDRPTFESR